jgi:glycosyltransferase involved in cell wall biosynthesis
MRILQISDELPQVVMGGSGRIAWETGRALRRLGHEVGMVTAAPAGTFARDVDGIRIYALPRLPRRWAHYRSVFSRRRPQEVLAAVKDFRPDVVHAHDLAWQLGYAWLPAVRRCGIPCFYTAHGVMHVAYGKVTGTEPWLWWSDLRRARWTLNPLRNAFIRRYLAHCDAILCVSDALRRYLERFGYANMATLHNGIDLAFWQPEGTRPEARRLLGLPQDRALFLFAGRIGHDKGSTAVLNTLPASSVLAIAGEADDSLFGRLGNRVRYFPRQQPEQMRLLYTACDVTLVPSIYLDPFPTVCLESQACARPVVATTCGGAGESVRDGVTGWVVNPLDERRLRERLDWCAASVRELPAYGARGRDHVARNFSQDRYCARLLQLYAAARQSRQACGGRERPASGSPHWIAP